MKRVDSEIEISASPEQVWSVLVDFPRWRQWNRVMPALEGEPVEGDRVELELAVPGRRSSRRKPRLVRVADNRELRWRDQVLARRVFVSEHWFTLEPAPCGCRVRHGERFAGWLALFIGGKTLEKTAQVFALMNHDLKQRVEDVTRPEARCRRRRGPSSFTTA